MTTKKAATATNTTKKQRITRPGYKILYRDFPWDALAEIIKKTGPMDLHQLPKIIETQFMPKVIEVAAGLEQPTIVFNAASRSGYYYYRSNKDRVRIRGYKRKTAAEIATEIRRSEQKRKAAEEKLKREKQAIARRLKALKEEAGRLGVKVDLEEEGGD